MTTLYKLTNSDGMTRAGYANALHWSAGVTHAAPGGGTLCSAAYIHAYPSPELAVMLDPAHGHYTNEPDAQLWRCEGVIERTEPDKIGCTTLTTLERVALPPVTLEQRVRFAILAARAVCSDPVWTAWAGAWLDGSDRSEAAAAAAWTAAWAAARAAAWTAAWAARAAEAAAAAAAEAAAWTAAWAAVRAAAAAEADPALDLATIAEAARSAPPSQGFSPAIPSQRKEKARHDP